MEYGALCEYHPLKKVLMFHPGPEVKQITLDSFKELSFRDVVYWRRFQQEHDEFCNILSNEKVEIVYLNQILTNQSIFNPNSVYVRDAGLITPQGYVEMRMANRVRSFEPTLMIKAFEYLKIPKLHSITMPGVLEGGDFVFPDNETVLIGYGPRTNEEGAIQAMKALLGLVVKTVVLVPLPSWRVHLDGGLMFLDKDLIVYHPPSITTFPVRVFREKESVELLPLMEFLKNNYDPEKVSITNNELYLFGANVVCLDKRKCVIYEWNERIIRQLNQYNVDTIPIQGSELHRGGGGPHCMTLPILRQN